MTIALAFSMVLSGGATTTLTAECIALMLAMSSLSSDEEKHNADDFNDGDVL